jgi:hypothetical protein
MKEPSSIVEDLDTYYLSVFEEAGGLPRYETRTPEQWIVSLIEKNTAPNV